MTKYKIGSPDWADMAERGEWGFMAKMLGEAIEKLKPVNLSGLGVAQQIAEARSEDGWRTYKSPLEEETNPTDNGQLAMDHLGQVLYTFSDLDEGDRSNAFQDAMDFYNKNNPDKQVSAVDGYKTYILQRGPLDDAIGLWGSSRVCKGDWSLGSACGKCTRCLSTAKAHIDKLNKQIADLKNQNETLSFKLSEEIQNTMNYVHRSIEKDRNDPKR